MWMWSWEGEGVGVGRCEGVEARDVSDEEGIGESGLPSSSSPANAIGTVGGARPVTADEDDADDDDFPGLP